MREFREKENEEIKRQRNNIRQLRFRRAILEHNPPKKNMI